MNGLRNYYEEDQMFTRIVVPLDKADPASAALSTARALAARTGAALALLHVINHRYPSTDLADEQRQIARRWLREEAGALPHDAAAPAIIAIRDGNPAEEIRIYADEIEADLICMATHARAGIGRIVLGSVAERVVQDAHLPVLLVRQEVATPDIPLGAPVVVPLDGSPRSEAALPYAVALAKRLGAPLTLVRVWDVITPTIVGPYAMPMDPQTFEEVEEATEGAAIAYLTNVAARLASDIAARTVSLHGNAAEQLAVYLHKERPGFVVMGTHGRGGVPRWVLGSVAMELVRATVGPVLLIGDACARATEQATALAEHAGAH